MNGAYIINNNYTKNFRPETINLIKKDVTLKKILIYGFLKLLLIERSIYQYFISLVLYNIFGNYISLCTRFLLKSRVEVQISTLDFTHKDTNKLFEINRFGIFYLGVSL